MKIEIVRADITREHVDVIVNAANSSLLGGGGVDGAIHRAAGKMLVQECRLLGGCKVGEAKITRGYDLPAKLVIHTVGPKYLGGANNEAAKLQACYENSLRLADDYKCQTIAFPAISTGIYGYPVRAAAQVSLQTVLAYTPTYLETARFCLFDDHTLREFQTVFSELTGTNTEG